MMRHVGVRYLLLKFGKQQSHKNRFCVRWEFDGVRAVQKLKGMAQQEHLGPLFRGEWFCVSEEDRHHHVHIYIYTSHI